MLCPYCQSEMTKGYIQCRDGVYWTPDRALVPALSGIKKGAVSLRNDPEYGNSTSAAHLCNKCRRVIIEIRYID